jgi:DNA-binding response OmpR family regulator
MKVGNSERENGKGLPAGETALKKAPRLLLAEDDFDMRTLLAWSFRRIGYEVVECPDGVRLLDFLFSTDSPADPGDFDLIVSDIRMPGVTGLEVLEGIRESKGFPPMILITAFGDRETHEKARRLGAAAILDKPFEIEDLLARAREIVSP